MPRYYKGTMEKNLGHCPLSSVFMVALLGRVMREDYAPFFSLCHHTIYYIYVYVLVANMKS